MLIHHKHMVMIRRTLMQKVVADESVARCLVYCHTTDALQFLDRDSFS